jgi:hypothetical protein
MDVKARKLAETYNAFINVFWTALHLAPVALYCYLKLDTSWLYGALMGSLAVMFLPLRIISLLQLGRSTDVYRRIGIIWVRKLAQDGDLVNRLVRKRYPGYRVIWDTQGLTRYIAKTLMFEKFHLSSLVFLLLAAVKALADHHLVWGILILVNNVLYNVYPIFLQQYNRIRVERVLRGF